MKLIVTADSPSIDARLDPRFGRCACFLTVDPDTMEWQAVANPALNARGGAGIQAAQFVTNQKCEAVISSEFGPNAYQALNTAGIAMYSPGDCSTVIEAIQRFKSGEIEPLNSSTGTGRMHR
jgi:predicted Fe-Mo cluster-binding NifX family protein